MASEWIFLHLLDSIWYKIQKMQKGSDLLTTEVPGPYPEILIPGAAVCQLTVSQLGTHAHAPL